MLAQRTERCARQIFNCMLGNTLHYTSPPRLRATSPLNNTRQMYCFRLEAMFLVPSVTARGDVEGGGGGGAAARGVDLDARQLCCPRLKVTLTALLVTPRSRRRQGRGSAAHR